MPRRLLGIFILLLVLVPSVRAQGDVVLLKVGSEAVSLDEFEYHFRKSQEKREDVFAETYGRFKQKVQCAKALGLDTLESYKRQVANFHQRMERSNGTVAVEASSSKAGREWIKLKHVTWPLSQSAGKEELRKGNQRMDSIYTAWRNGTDIQAEELPWMQTRHLLSEWQTQLEKLPKQEYSRPFLSPMGIHLVAWLEKEKSFPTAGQDVSDSDKLLQIKEMEDALLDLAFQRYLDETLVCGEQDLEAYFKSHRAHYGYGMPHFRGAVIHCRDKKEAKAIKKYLKKYPEAMWQDAVGRMPAEVSKGCRIETGLFAIGANPYVDKLVFKCGTYESPAGYPYTWVLGKKLKKGLADYKDVREKLEKDCRHVRKTSEMEAAMKKYEVEIDKKVLKTVNRAGNK